MTQNIYSIYFNTTNDVVFLGLCKGYTDLETNFDVAVQLLIKNIRQDCPDTATPTKIYKYEEKTNGTADLFLSSLKADISFPQGIAFVKKKYEACVYEKTCFPGKIYNSYTTKYLGRIGIISQPFTLPENIKTQIDNLNRQLDVSQKIISHQEQTIRRQNSEILRLEHFSSPPSRGPVIDRTHSLEEIPCLVKKSVVRKIEMSSVLQELQNKISSGQPLLKRTNKSSIMLDDIIKEVNRFCINVNPE